jgi:hypothetical protein
MRFAQCGDCYSVDIATFTRCEREMAQMMAETAQARRNFIVWEREFLAIFQAYCDAI